MASTLQLPNLAQVNQAAAVERAEKLVAARLIASPDDMERVKTIEKDTLFRTFNA